MFPANISLQAGKAPAPLTAAVGIVIGKDSVLPVT